MILRKVFRFILFLFQNLLSKNLLIQFVSGRRVWLYLLVFWWYVQAVVMRVIHQKWLVQSSLVLSLPGTLGGVHWTVGTCVRELHPVICSGLDSSSPFISLVERIIYTIMIMLSKASLLHDFDVFVASKTCGSTLCSIIHNDYLLLECGARCCRIIVANSYGGCLRVVICTDSVVTRVYPITTMEKFFWNHLKAVRVQP